MISKTIGGDRLGAGNKMKTRLRNYERSTHDLGKQVRTTMAAGTLVPVFTEIVLKGDVWEMDISSLIRTHATNGPIFGSFKFQVDVFTFDVRLYNKQLHNNLTGVGNNMKSILFPMLRLNGPNINMEESIEANEQQISPSSLLAYTGIRGLGTLQSANGVGRVEILRNAQPILGYYDIYKNYYANKQEEIGVVVSGQGRAVEANIGSARRDRPGLASVSLLNQTLKLDIIKGDQIVVNGPGLLPQDIAVNTILNGVAGEYRLIELGNWARVETNDYGLIFNGFDPTGTEEAHPLEYWRETGNLIGTKDQGVTLGDEIELVQFPLTNIDDMREAIFAQPKSSPLIIGFENEEKRGLPYDAITGQINVEGIAQNQLASVYPLAGLAIKTYQSDRFNNWLATTWIENISNISAVDTSSGSFTMDALNLAKKVYDLMNRVAVSGGTYEDWYEAVYGTKVHGAPEMPVYRGGMSSEITFDEVISSSDSTTSDGSNQPLGTLGGRGKERAVQGGKIRFEAQEHGYVMVIASITPRIDYSQGNKWWGKLETMDDFHKPQLDGIGFQELLTDEMAAWDTQVNADGTETFFSAGKQPAWMQYMTNQNETYGEFARINSEMFMTLNRRYQATGIGGRIEDLTTYIDPTKFNYAFAYTKLQSQPFWVQLGFDTTVRRVMSAAIIPNL